MAFVFQSTLPVLGETLAVSSNNALIVGFQSTLPVLGETSFELVRNQWIDYFNPLSLCWERPHSTTTPTQTNSFQSTLPVLGET